MRTWVQRNRIYLRDADFRLIYKVTQVKNQEFSHRFILIEPLISIIMSFTISVNPYHQIVHSCRPIFTPTHFIFRYFYD